jgi:hypothetical protein
MFLFHRFFPVFPWFSPSPRSFRPLMGPQRSPNGPPTVPQGSPPGTPTKGPTRATRLVGYEGGIGPRPRCTTSWGLQWLNVVKPSTQKKYPNS